jgi:hypothetical protein
LGTLLPIAEAAEEAVPVPVAVVVAARVDGAPPHPRWTIICLVMTQMMSRFSML